MTGYKWNAYILFFLLDNSFPFTYTLNENDYQYNKNAKENNMRKKQKDRCIAYSDAVYYGGEWICHSVFQGIVVDNYRA